jgi:elongation factor P
MIEALELLEGMVLRIEREIYKVLEVEVKAGAAKMTGVVKTKLLNVRSGHMWEPHFNPKERFEEVQLDRRQMEFLFSENGSCTFMRPDTFEQIEVSKAVIGPAEKFLQPGMEVPVDFFEGQALHVDFPEVVEIRVAETAPATHSQKEMAWKEAKLENGVKLQVPLFVGPGEVVRVEVRTGHYVDRVRMERKRGA